MGSIKSAGASKGCDILSSRPRVWGVQYNVGPAGGFYRRSRSKGQQTFSVKDRLGSILGLARSTVPATAIQLCGRRATAATDNTEANVHDCVPVKLDLRTQVAARFGIVVFYNDLEIFLPLI